MMCALKENKTMPGDCARVAGDFLFDLMSCEKTSLIRWHLNRDLKEMKSC